jgi:phage terminase large subunit
MTVVTKAPPVAQQFTPELSRYTSDEMLELLTTPVYDAHATAASELLVDENGELVVDKATGSPIYASRIIAHQGGSRSSKTRSLAQFVVARCMEQGPGYICSLVRGTLPALRGSALKDFIAVLNTTPLPGGGVLADVVEHRSLDKEYHFPSGAVLEYFSVDDEQKLRGRARNDLWVNEANELIYDEWKQLLMRTTGQVFIDFNPSDDEHHWIQKHVLTREDCTLIISTYKDNPYLPQTLIDEIESYRLADENYWKVYGLGQLGVSGTTIYTHYRLAEKMPTEYDDEAFGLDFGFGHPTALVRVVEKDGARYAEQLIYRSQLTNPDLIALLKDAIPVEKRKKVPIYADAAEPGIIAEIFLAGFHVIPANKSVGDGIRNVKSAPLWLLKDSTDLVREIRGYKWKVDKSGNVLDEPVKIKDDAVDALRYACYNMTLAPRAAATPVTKHQSFSRDDSTTTKALGRRPGPAGYGGRKHQSFKRKT